jgi:anaerobic selenocysteine-containing dehydrogenase
MNFRKLIPKLREFTGRYTAELDRTSGGFGLGQVPSRLAPDAVSHAICGFCSVGCNLKIHRKDGRAVNLSADAAYPVNLGMACPKGWAALHPLAAPDRATTPLLRVKRGGDLKPVDWNQATGEFVSRMKAVAEKHGPESIAFLSTGQICAEEMAMLGAFAKFGMGMVHGDGNTRQCMATSVVAYKQSFGFDAPPFSYADFEESDVLVFIGANPCIAHPVLWQRVLKNRRNPRIIVIDPRRTETAQAAHTHLPLEPKSDLALLYGVARILAKSGRTDAAFLASSTSGYADFEKFLEPYTPDATAEATGLSVADIAAFADAVAPGKRVSFWWTMGVNQGHQGVRTAQAIVNLALMGGHIGKPGTGANSITGQCNAMGSRLFANATNLLGGHEFTNPAHREKIATATGVPVERIPDKPSWAYDRILEGVEKGEIKALWIIATNPAHSWINQRRFHKLVDKLELLVVQDMYHSTETAKLADLFLPAAGWGEKTGVFINSERRIGLVNPVAEPPGKALPDFDIFRNLAEAWGCGDMFKDWSTPEAVFQVLKKCSAGQPCDITGIRDYAHLEELGGIQWPHPASEAPLTRETNERRLFADGKFFTGDARAKFLFDAPAPPPESTDAAYPFALLTGRGSSAQWHTQTRTAKSAVLRKLYPADPWVEIHPDDADRLRLDDHDWVVIESRRGFTRARARVTATIGAGQVFLPMHDSTMNRVTHDSFDPHSRQPNYKYCAVRLVKA